MPVALDTDRQQTERQQMRRHYLATQHFARLETDGIVIGIETTATTVGYFAGVRQCRGMHLGRNDKKSRASATTALRITIVAIGRCRHTLRCGCRHIAITAKQPAQSNQSNQSSKQCDIETTFHNGNKYTIFLLCSKLLHIFLATKKTQQRPSFALLCDTKIRLPTISTPFSAHRSCCL